jgi:NAD(P)H-dependent FMN reductase
LRYAVRQGIPIRSVAIPNGPVNRNIAVEEGLIRRMVCTLLLISGSLREGSTNTSVLRTVQAGIGDEIDSVLYEDLGSVPPFNPDHDVEPLHPAVRRVRDLVHRADAILLSTPEYAGTIPGSLKNLLEWLIGDAHQGSIYQKPVAWVNASPRGATKAHESLRAVLDYANAFVVEDACTYVPVFTASIGSDGLVSDPGARDQLQRAARTLGKRACSSSP